MNQVKENLDMLEFIQACWPVDHEEAVRVNRLFVFVFGTEEAEKHIRINAPTCSVADISPDSYLELCAAIKGIMNISDRGNPYFISGIRDLILARCTQR